jgi:hypothetical protein
MPREQINYPQPVEALVIDGPSGLPTGFRTWTTDPALHVNWHGDDCGNGHVQVAFEADPAYLRLALDSPNEPADRTSMYTPVLTAAEIKRLIRTLKRASRAAYGKDAAEVGTASPPPGLSG